MKTKTIIKVIIAIFIIYSIGQISRSQFALKTGKFFVQNDDVVTIQISDTTRGIIETSYYTIKVKDINSYNDKTEEINFRKVFTKCIEHSIEIDRTVDRYDEHYKNF